MQLAAGLSGVVEESIAHSVLKQGGEWVLRYNYNPFNEQRNVCKLRCVVGIAHFFQYFPPLL